MTTTNPSPHDPVPSSSSQPDGTDGAVESEWKKLEAERIAEECEEAREDILEATLHPVPKTGTWSWLALAVALAAGGLVAAGLARWMPEPSHEDAPILPPRAVTPSEPADDATDEHDTAASPSETAP